MPRHQGEHRGKNLPVYVPMQWTLREIKAAIPATYFVRDMGKGLYFLTRDFLLAIAAWSLALQIDPFFGQPNATGITTHLFSETIRWLAWGVYWWFQGLIFTGIWVIGHECGHGAFSDYKLVNDFVGFLTHTFLWTPYFSWKISHHRHHRHHGSMEKDEVYVPKTRSDLGLPREGDPRLDYDEVFGDTPIYTLFMLVRQQLLAYPAYLLFNVSGQKTYPKWTNHFDPNSILFTPAQRTTVLISNAGIAFMTFAVTYASKHFGFAVVLKYYGIPWLFVSHWFIMITYLHHTDPVVPHYRGTEWTFQRGAAATVDRPILGWQGRFFLHDVAHYHVIHHFFPKMPFYHAPEATKYLKAFLGEYYMYDDTPAFKALWRNYNFCQFVEDDGGVVFYRNREGHAVCKPELKHSKDQ